jgi:hypothetical protein
MFQEISNKFKLNYSIYEIDDDYKLDKEIPVYFNKKYKIYKI